MNAYSLQDVPTPAVVLDKLRLQANCERMAERARSAGVKLRPHLKTAKCAEVAALATAGQFGGITVSTPAELEYFFDAGFRDMTYAVGIAPSKMERIERLLAKGARIQVLLDSMEILNELAVQSSQFHGPLSVLIEIDSGGRRAGVAPNSMQLIELARRIAEEPRLSLEGVLTHAGHSYHAADAAARKEIAIAERDAVVYAAKRIRTAGFDCPTVSIGSTPTALTDIPLDGVTEIRPGVYMFFDLSQAQLGVCTIDDIAVSVLTTVIGHHREAGHLLVDAGGLALSKDMSANEFEKQIGYGLVCGADGKLLRGVYVADVHQEHGLIRHVEDDLVFEKYPVGSRLRILPNHACMTVAPYPEYQVIDSAAGELSRWAKTTGW